MDGVGALQNARWRSCVLSVAQVGRTGDLATFKQTVSVAVYTGHNGNAASGTMRISLLKHHIEDQCRAAILAVISVLTIVDCDRSAVVAGDRLAAIAVVGDGARSAVVVAAAGGSGQDENEEK